MVQLNGFDLVPPRTFIRLLFYIPLGSGVSFQDAFAHLQAGLQDTLDRLPFLDGKVFERPRGEPGWVNGHLQIRHRRRHGETPRQLVFADLSAELPSYDELRDAGFEFSAFPDSLLMDAPLIPDLTHGADVFAARANFVEGGCLLATGFHHSTLDGTGMIAVMRIWAEHCRARQQQQPESHATKASGNCCEWLVPDCTDRGVLERLWRAEWDPSRKLEDIDPSTWGYLGFKVPGQKEPEPAAGSIKIPAYITSGGTMEASIFYIPASKVAELRREVHAAAPPESSGQSSPLSTNDVVMAFFWRGLLRARYRAAAAAGAPAGPEAVAHLESPLDARSSFSAALPSPYLGNLVTVNRIACPLAELVAEDADGGPATSLRRIAELVRAGAAKAGPGMVRDAFALLRAVRDFASLEHGFTRLDGWDVMITSLILLSLDPLQFSGGDGPQLFGNGGKVEALRHMMDAFNATFRLCVMLPMKPGGGMELVVSLFPAEMAELERDAEFGRYASLLCH